MIKSKSFFKKLKNINISINNLLEKNLNKLKLNNLIILARSNKIILTFVAVFVLSVSYLLIPTFFKQSEISKEFKLDLFEKLNLNFNFSKKLNYNIFPKPHFVIDDVEIFYNQQELSKVKNLKINISLKNLFSLKNIKIKDVIIENASFNLNKDNQNIFLKILQNNFKDFSLKILSSNIFFKNSKNEVLFINKILNMKYFYDSNDFKNKINSKNEIFNIPYEIEFFDDKDQKKIFTNVNINFLKLQIENELNYSKNINVGKSELIFQKSKSLITYKSNSKFLNFTFFDKLENPSFSYNGNFNFIPFYSNIIGTIQNFNTSYFLDSNNLLLQLIKTEIFNNKNVDFKLNISGKNILHNPNFVNINLYSKIQEGLIDIDDTNFKWKTFVDFKLSDSLVFVDNGELIIDAKLQINIKDYNEIYKVLLTPKKYRKKLKKIDLSFLYNFDQKIMKFTDIRIDKKYSQKINTTMRKIILKDTNMQNKIYLKNILNEAIKNYDG